ncbi:hypothetical protein DPMN_165390 [Dreissena polymorpha]|uniref:Uncharacterized protein n=1 Tax=Dreissena polymorpha TaxID=45954 RepID=A0A9D4EUQ5_DREPO|nr:hypothetical protein DPMN_165390 [Dreissena polymorpha]
MCNGVSCSHSIRVSTTLVQAQIGIWMLMWSCIVCSKESKETEAAQIVDQGLAWSRAEASVRSV